MWRDGVRIVRAAALADARANAGNGRATVFDFAGSGGKATWIGSVNVSPGSKTGTHDHGRHEVMIYVVKGEAEIRWGERLEFAADIWPGDCAYFAPYVPHQERVPDDGETVEFLVVRSDNERIVNPLRDEPIDSPEYVG